MNLQEKIQSKFEALLREGKSILDDNGWDGRELYRFPPSNDYQRFMIETSNLIKIACGEKSEHYLQLQRLSKDNSIKTNSYYFPVYYGLLQAAQRDYSEGMIFNIRNIIRAELFDDFLSQAEYLLSEGFILPAASLAGAVLEDSLRKLCDKYQIEYPEKTKINNLNSSLAKKEIYDKLTSKLIIAYADIRNNADHMWAEKVKNDDVQDMVNWIRRFISQYLN